VKTLIAYSLTDTDSCANDPPGIPYQLRNSPDPSHGRDTPQRFRDETAAGLSCAVAVITADSKSYRHSKSPCRFYSHLRHCSMLPQPYRSCGSSRHHAVAPATKKLVTTRLTALHQEAVRGVAKVHFIGVKIQPS
jgi:hypothetical protein